MRGTKAKMLRRLAEKKGPRNRENVYTCEDKKGKQTRTIRLWPGCVRQIYKRLKRAYRDVPK